MGQIVGKAYSDDINADHAFLYDNGTMYDLNSYTTGLNGFVLGRASAINDNGWIIGLTEGTGSYSGHAWLLTPIPEPSSIVLLGVAAVSLVSRRSRKSSEVIASEFT